MTRRGKIPRIDAEGIIDPLVWLERNDFRTLEWLGIQNQRAHSWLSGLPTSTYLPQFAGYDGASSRQRVPLGRGGRYFFLQPCGAKERDSLWMADGWVDDGVEIISPARFDSGGELAEFAAFWPSPSGSHILIAVCRGGRQAAELAVVDFESRGEAHVIERLPTPAPIWAAWRDRETYFFARRINGAQALTLRTLDGVERPVSLPCDTKGANVVPITREDGTALIVFVYGPENPDGRVLVAYDTRCPVFHEIPGIVGVDLRFGGWGRNGPLLVVCSGPNERSLIEIEMNGALCHFRQLYFDRTGTLNGACAGGDGNVLLLFQNRWGDNSFQHLSPEGETSDLTIEGGLSLSEWTFDASKGAVLFAAEGWHAPAQLWTYDFRMKVFTLLHASGPSLDISAVYGEALSHDGVSIPVTLLKPGRCPDGIAMPCLLLGYGAFGITLAPRCLGSLAAWFAAGGMVAIAHVRGGGELGPSWHEAGRGVKKINSFLDFIAVARWLAAEGHSQPEQLCAWGQSAGGLLVLGAMVMAPESFAAVIANSPVTDMARYALFGDGGHWTTEFGDTLGDAKVFSDVARWSPLHGLQLEGQYAPSLIFVGSNDERVAPMHGRKMTAALQATGSHGPHLLLEQRDCGHDGPITLAAQTEQVTIALRFAAWATGLRYVL